MLAASVTATGTITVGGKGCSSQAAVSLLLLARFLLPWPRTRAAELSRKVTLWMEPSSRVAVDLKLLAACVTTPSLAAA